MGTSYIGYFAVIRNKSESLEHKKSNNVAR
jgi:hypothetical protein